VRELDYVQSNAYSTFAWLGGNPAQYPDNMVGAPAAMRAYYDRFMGRYNRPVLIGEWGGHWMHNTKDILDSELHTGLWAQAMTPMGGATGFWWWLHVHYNDRYGEFAALARFLSGEDLRGITEELENGRTVRFIPPAGANHPRLAMGVGDGKKRAYAWIYDRRAPWGDEDKAPVEGARLELHGLSEGTYEVEFWDPFKGERAGTGQFAARGGPLTVTLPKFRRELAVKVRWKGPAPEGVSTPPSAHEAPPPPPKRPPEVSAPATPPPSVRVPGRQPDPAREKETAR
jgi:hypothetical protein